jgi:hypothetical protein
MIGNAKGDVIGMFFGRTVSLVLIGCIVAAIVLPTLLKHFTPKRYRAPAHAK